MAGASFGTRLAAAIRSSGTPLCMGIDPHPGMVPALFGNSTEPGHPDTIRAISDFTMACLAAAKGRVAAIKPQAAFFEAQGPDGMRVLAELGRSAVDAGMLVIMDAKRNDIGSTNAAYAEAWIGHDAPFPSDALTVNAFLGLDTLEPLLARADAVGAGLFVLTRTSCSTGSPNSSPRLPRRVVTTRVTRRLASSPGPHGRMRHGPFAPSCHPHPSWCRASARRAALPQTRWPG